MKEEDIKELFEQFEAIANEYEGVECWSARELAQVLGYSQWRNFEGIIEKAKASCTNAGQEVSYHFADVSKMINLAKGAQREVKDYMLTVMLAISLLKTVIHASHKSLLPKTTLPYKLAEQNWCKSVCWNTNVYKHVQNLQKQRSVSLVCCMKEGWTAKALPSFAH